MNYDISLNQDILKDLGFKLRQQRLQLHLTTKELSLKSGISVRTLSGFERGEKNISFVNFIELLRALRLLNNLQDLIPEVPLISPLEMMEREAKRPKRIKK